MITDLCSTEYTAVGFDALRSTIGKTVTWDFPEHVPVVADCIKPDQPGQWLWKIKALCHDKSRLDLFLFSRINHKSFTGLSFSADTTQKRAGIYCSARIPLSWITSLTRFSFSLWIGILLHTGLSTWFLVVAMSSR